MISHLDRKLFRDLRRMKGQAIAVALVMGCGLSMMIMSRSLIRSLESTRQEYYEAHRFADVFVHLKRAPNSLVDRVGVYPRSGGRSSRPLRPGHARSARTRRTRQWPRPFPAGS